ESIADITIELDGRTADRTEHFPLGFGPALGLIEPDTVDGRAGVVVDRAKHHDQRRQKPVLPRTARMEAQHVAGEIVVEPEPARAQILFDRRAAWIASGVPNFSS